MFRRPAFRDRASASAPTAVIEGGADFDAEDEPNFNRVDASVGNGRRRRRPGGARKVRRATVEAIAIVAVEVAAAAPAAAIAEVKVAMAAATAAAEGGAGFPAVSPADDQSHSKGRRECGPLCWRIVR